MKVESTSGEVSSVNREQESGFRFLDLKNNLWVEKLVTGEYQNIHCMLLAWKSTAWLTYLVVAIKTNIIVSLSPTDGVFHSLPISGDKLSPRSHHCGWAYKGQAFFFDDYTTRNITRDEGFLICFDPKANGQWSKPETKGQSPSLQDNNRVAVLENRVFIHGERYNSKMSVMDLLDMENMIWTLVESKSVPGQLECHSLSPIFSSQLLLVGGPPMVVEGQEKSGPSM